MRIYGETRARLLPSNVDGFWVLPSVVDMIPLPQDAIWWPAGCFRVQSGIILLDGNLSAILMIAMSFESNLRLKLGCLKNRRNMSEPNRVDQMYLL